MSDRGPLRSAVAWSLGYLLLAVLLTAPLSLHPRTRLPDDGDAVQGAWIVWWGATHLSAGFPDLFDANVYYPHPRGLLYSEPLLGQALLGLPLYSAWDSVLATNFLMLFTLATSAAAFHLLARELTGSSMAAGVGALVYTYSAYTYSHLPRLQLVSLQWIPLALWCLHRHVSGGGRRYAWSFGGALALQTLSCLYYAAFLGLALPLLGAAYATSAGRARRVAGTAVCGLALAGSIALLLGHEYRSLYKAYGFRPDVTPLVDLASFFWPSPDQAALGCLLGLRFPRDQPLGNVEHFLGFSTLLLAGAGILARLRARDASGAVWAAYGAVGGLGLLLAGGTVLTVADHAAGPGPFALLRHLPAYDTLRDPPRFVVLTHLALGLFAAAGVAAVLRRLVDPRARVALAVSLATLVTGERWSPAHTQGVPLPVGPLAPPAYAWLRGEADRAAVVELPVRPYRALRFTSLDAYYSTLHRRSTVFGRPSFAPPALELLRWELRGFPDARSLALLRGIGVSRALVHPNRWEDQDQRRAALRRLEERSDALPLLAAFDDPGPAAWSRHQMGGERIYAVSPAPFTREQIPCSCREIPAAALRPAGSGEADPGHSVDRRRETRWNTGGQQGVGAFLEVRFDRPRTVARVEIDLAPPFEEFARNLAAEAWLGEVVTGVRLKQDPAHLVELVRTLVHRPGEARMRYDFDAVTADRLRLSISREEYGAPGWSVPEIHIYELEPDLP